MTQIKATQVKAVFFDVDGTLFSFKEHQEPASTREAVRKLHAAGIIPILATGRPIYQLSGIDQEPFDTYITLNGQYCFSQHGVYHNVPIDKTDVEAIVNYGLTNGIPTLCMQKDKFYISARNERVKKLESMIGMTYTCEDITQALNQEIYQFNVYQEPSRDDDLLSRTHCLATARWTDLFADVFPQQGGKAPAVIKTMEHLGITADEALAFGDGGNDLGMFSLVGTSIAMGNADEKVKEQATMVTEDVDNHGIYNACVRLGLID
ncbi:Cof-type HAD-IIB family hydrolase [Atopobium deltae]|uniref:Cof-like hydrolase n=1 Tax=Atopobium deltae TaxID=1393034 RepID=A0A133XPY7_9ACTN|nr:Cof-type HAD-IIB family hydrolase [Atopobium deltae]KXB33002.1 Cof-like hydrolase [Atopobium deltae]